MTAVLWGVGLTALVTTILTLIWGQAALLPGLAFGGLATVIQAIAVLALRQAWRGDTAALLKGFGKGIGLRLLGIVLLGLAIGFARTAFPPLPSALGFLGVLLPLLFLEVRLAR